MNYIEYITINEQRYILGNYIIKHAPIFCTDVKIDRDLKNCVNKDYYIYASYINTEWKQNTGKVKKTDKILIHENFLFLNERLETELLENTIPEYVKENMLLKDLMASQQHQIESLTFECDRLLKDTIFEHKLELKDKDIIINEERHKHELLKEKYDNIKEKYDKLVKKQKK